MISTGFRVRVLTISPAIALIAFAACSALQPNAFTGELDETYPPPTPDLASIPTTSPPNAVDFVSEPGQFTITFPCCDLARGALEQFTITEEPFGQPIDCQVLHLPEDGADWRVQYCDLPAELASAKSPDQLLDWARDDALQDARAHLAEEQSITTHFEIPARARSLLGPANMRGILLDGTFKARLYLVGARIYRVAARVYNANWGNRLAMMDPFLDSFFVESALTIPFEPTPTPP
jgi:hypothetical protein